MALVTLLEVLELVVEVTFVTLNQEMKVHGILVNLDQLLVVVNHMETISIDLWHQKKVPVGHNHLLDIAEET